MDRFKSPDRYRLPELASFKRKIADDDFEIDMPTSNETKAAAIEGKASETWRALRIASKSRLAVLDKIESYEKVDIIFDENAAQDSEGNQAGDTEEAAEFPKDRSPIVILDAGNNIGSGRGKSPIVSQLLERHPGVFARVPAHITRKPEAGEAPKIDFHFVDVQSFRMLRDGDQLIEFSDHDGPVNHGTARKSVDAIVESGKVPLLELDREGIQQVKDFGFSARYIFTGPQDVLDAQLAANGQTSKGFYDSVIIGGPGASDAAYQSLAKFIYGDTAGAKPVMSNGEAAAEAGPAEVDVSMADHTQSGTA